MSIQLRKQRILRLLFLLRHKQTGDAEEIGKLFECHPSTIKRLIAQLREDGYKIIYDKGLKKYIMQEKD